MQEFNSISQNRKNIFFIVLRQRETGVAKAAPVSFGQERENLRHAERAGQRPRPPPGAEATI